jgi:hypothetical protein
MPRLYSGDAMKDPAHAQAMLALLHAFEAAWSSKICSVCKEPKWALYPFCRSCSIKLQRVGLLKKGHGKASVLANYAGKEWREWDTMFLRYVTVRWDQARDYLITKRREPDWMKPELEDTKKE